MLHDRIINAVCGAREEGLCIGANEVKIVLGASHGLLAGGEHCRLMLTQRLQITIGPKQKQAAVPIIRAVGHIARRGGLIGLLDEFRQTEDPVGQRLAAAHVAIPGLRAAGHDAKCHQLAGVCGGHGPLYGGPKCCGIRHVMISRQHQQ